MDRFVAFAWDDRSTLLTQRVAAQAEDLLSSDRGWSVALHAPGLVIFLKAKPGGKRLLATMSGPTGIIIGPLFRRGDEGSGAIYRLSEPEASRIVSTQGDALLRDFWGSYVALWRSGEGTLEVLRDPSGAQPCFRTSCAGVEILCSVVADIAGLRGVHFSIDQQFLAASLARTTAITRHTGLAELSEVLPGERMTLERSRPPTRTWVWRAIELARKVHKQTLADATVHARDVTERCLSAWAGLSDKIVVRLSGGLDSSTVAAFLRRHATGDVTAIHLTGKGYEAHELTFARQAAQFIGIELLEITDEAGDTNYRSLLGNEPVLARPTRQIFGAAADRLLCDVYATLAADTVMSGHGGDVVFFQRSLSGLSSADDLKLNGPSPAFWRRCYENAALLERSVWGVMADAVSATLRNALPPMASVQTPQAKHVTLLDGQTRAVSPEYLQDPETALYVDLPPAKAGHLSALRALRDYHGLRGGSLMVDERHPLMSQPIVEFALATPTYLFSEGGLDRSLQRRAFQDLLPEEIYRRTSKGFVNHALTVTFHQNLPWFREILLDGEVVRLLDMDRTRIEALLTPTQLQRESGLFDVMNLIAAEVWLSSWSALRRSAL